MLFSKKEKGQGLVEYRCFCCAHAAWPDHRQCFQFYKPKPDKCAINVNLTKV